MGASAHSSAALSEAKPFSPFSGLLLMPAFAPPATFNRGRALQYRTEWLEIRTWLPWFKGWRGGNSAELKVTPFKTAIHLEKPVLPQQSSLLTNFWEIKSKQINWKLKCTSTHPICTSYCNIPYSAMNWCYKWKTWNITVKINSAEKTSNCIQIQETVLNSGCKMKRQSTAERTHHRELGCYTHIWTLPSVQMWDVISKHAHKPVLVEMDSLLYVYIPTNIQ